MMLARARALYVGAKETRRKIHFQPYLMSACQVFLSVLFMDSVVMHYSLCR